MIAWLQGRILDRTQTGKIVLNVNGVGYDIETSLPSFFRLEAMNDEVALHIHTIVREDALLLYGFLDKQERAVFRALIKVNGVGPKMAIAILSSISPDDFVNCIQQKNTAALTQLPGIGKKTAERLVVEMRDSLQQLSLNLHVESPLSQHNEQAIQALEALGYRPQEARKVIRDIDDGKKTCEQLIRQALQVLS